MATTAEPTTRAEILAELLMVNAQAKRLTVKAADYGPLHRRINLLLTRLEYAPA